MYNRDKRKGEELKEIGKFGYISDTRKIAQNIGS